MEDSPSAYDALISSLSRCHRKKPRYDMEVQHDEVAVGGLAGEGSDAEQTDGEQTGEEEESVGDQTGEWSTYSQLGETLASSGNEDIPEVTESNDFDEDPSEVSDEEPVSTCSKDPFSVHVEETLSEEEITVLKKTLEQPLLYNRTLDKAIGCISTAVCLPTRDTVACMQHKPLAELHVKQRLVSQWKAAVNTQYSHEPSCLTALQGRLFSILNSYKDLLFARRTFENGEEIRRTYVLHALNHVLKTRSRVRKNNAFLHRAAKEGKQPEDFQDQGLTRPKVLILVPFREAALRIVDIAINLLLPNGEGQVNNKRRFYEEFKDESALPPKVQKPGSFLALFAGNIDDCFRLGLAVSNKIVKLYSEFYHSDILIASPLGLRMIIGAEGEKNRDYDYLSSLEVVIVDQADVLLMQNWEHLLHIFHHLHLQPKEAHGVDFSRLRHWCLNGWSKYYCQTAVFSSFPTPEINALFNKNCFSYAGKVKVNDISHAGTICQVVAQLPQMFHRMESQKLLDLPDARFKYFIDKILPAHTGTLMAQTLIFVSSYFDFVRLRNYMKKEEISFSHLSEYSKTSDISRARAFFLQGRKHFLLYTERLHFFKRFQVRGIKHIIFYSLPQYAEFYSDFLNFIETVGHSNATCTVMYSKYDALSLSRIVGSERARRMMAAEDSVHMLITGSQ